MRSKEVKAEEDDPCFGGGEEEEAFFEGEEEERAECLAKAAEMSSLEKRMTESA